MKKSLLFLSAILSGFVGNAQISLTYANHSPLIGDSSLIVSYDTSALIPKNTGANQTWNFSNINLDSTGIYISSYVTPPTFAPTGTTLSDQNPSNIQRHYKTSSNKLDILGFSSPGLSISLSGDLLYRTWPMSYNTSISDTGNGTYTASPNPLIPNTGAVVVNSKSVVSGYGTLIGPNGVTFNNVLQVLDTISFNIENLFPNIYQSGVSINFYTMSYYISNLKYPVITYTKSIKLDYAIDLQTSNIDYWQMDSTEVFEYNRTPPSATTGILLTANEKELILFPNPASNVLNILSNENTTVEIYSLDGRLIESHKVQGNLTLNVADYKSGIYFVRSIDENGNLSQQKFVKH